MFLKNFTVVSTDSADLSLKSWITITLTPAQKTTISSALNLVICTPSLSVF